MRSGFVGMLVVALAATGCKTLGFTEEQKDLSSNTTLAGKVETPDPKKPDQKIVVKKFNLDLKSTPPKVEVSLKNEGPAQDLFLAEIEFGYPVPAGSVAPYAPDFKSFVFENFVKDEERTEVVEGSQLQTDKPLFARLIVTTGANVRATTDCQASSVHGLMRGTLFLKDRVEVVGMDADMAADEPWVKFTLRNVDDKDPDKEIGNLRYTCQFFNPETGALIPLGKRFYALKSTAKPLGKKGDEVTIEVNPGKLDPGVSLVGSKPVLFVTLPKK
jgi:hypothetical protein